MTDPNSVVGIGLALVGIGFPTAVAMMKLMGNKKSTATTPRTILDRDIVTFGKCQKQHEDERKIVGGQLELVHQKIDTVNTRLGDTNERLKGISEGQTEILKAIKLNGGN